MTNDTDEIDFGWLFEDFLEVSLGRLPDGMWEMHYRTTAEHGAVIRQAIERVAAELPRAPETTEEQHDHDAVIELSRRFHVHKAGPPSARVPADLASRAMATIRDADERARVTRRGETRPDSGATGDPKLRATTEMILAMPVDDRLRQLEAESSFFSSIRQLNRAVAREFQLIGYIRLLAENDVDYLLVGGVGARIQGSATTTQDIDVMPEPSVENLERLARALSDETTEKKEAGATEYEPHASIDPMEFRTADVSSFRTRFGVIDVLMELPGVGPFDAVQRNARRYEWEAITITVASIDDIITSKETSDRAKDRRALDALYEARDHLREHPDPYELSEQALNPAREDDEP